MSENSKNNRSKVVPKSGKLKRSVNRKLKRNLKQTTVRQGQCRIIAGKWRGRVIKFDDAEGLRPTTDRIRETVFNWLQVYVPHSHCLDCFAGSGILGFEALSRDASEVVFIEQNKTTIDSLNDNCRKLDTNNAVVIHKDAMVWLAAMTSDGRLNEYPNECTKQKFDLIFLDPPFHSHLLEKSSALLNHSGCLTEAAIIYVENSVNDDAVLPENWICLKEKRSGQVRYRIYQNKVL